MITEIASIPMRMMCGPIQTTFPQCNSAELDEIYSFGSEFDLSGYNRLFKYKLIDASEKNVVERMIMTKDPIDVSKPWWTAPIMMYPIFSKVYFVPSKESAQIYRYLDGSDEIMQYCTAAESRRSIYVDIHDILTRDFGDRIAAPNLYESIVDGNDSRNIDNLITANNRYDIVPFFNANINPKCRQPVIPNYAHDRMCRLFSVSSPLSTLKHAIGSVYWGHIDTGEDPSDVFTINPSTTMFYEENDGYRCDLNRFLWQIESSSITDMNIRVHVDELSQITMIQNVFMCRYIGESPEYESERFTAKRDAIIEALVSWIKVSWGSCVSHIPFDVSLIKTWNEEIFIELNIESTSVQYYFDLTAFSIASPSFTEWCPFEF